MTFEICAANQASKGKCRPEMDILHTLVEKGWTRSSFIIIIIITNIVAIIIIIITIITIVDSAGWEKKG